MCDEGFLRHHIIREMGERLVMLIAPLISRTFYYFKGRKHLKSYIENKVEARSFFLGKNEPMGAMKFRCRMVKR